MEQKVAVKQWRRKDRPLPVYKTKGAAGMDLMADLEEDRVLQPGEIALIPTGIAIALPTGYEAQIRARSGLAVKEGITLINGVGTVDEDYRGEIKVGLINLGQEPFCIQDGDRIAQMVVARYEKIQWLEVEELEESPRGSGGFGHTGV